LLRIVAGLETQTEGDVVIGERNVGNVEPKDRNIAMVFQTYALYPHMTVRENISYGLRVRGLPKSEIAAKVEGVAKILELGALLDRRPRQLSGGQRQRVAMGRAIVREPAAFLFDEPLSNLDAKLRVQMRVELKELHAKLRTTSIYVTHDQVEAMTLADRLIVMNAGIAEQIGAPLEVYARPASVFVASFIGAPAMNLVSASLAVDGARIHVGDVGLDLAVPAAAGSAEITLGIRPEHLHLDPAGVLKFKVVLVEALGADTLVYGRFGATGEMLIARVPGTVKVATGDALALRVASEDLHVFDRTSGKRRN
jgi:sn-glycerol 3-phosphate transport system ATP-binding protein